MKTQVTLLFAFFLLGNLLAQNNLSVMTFNIRYDNPGDGEKEPDPVTIGHILVE